MEADVQAAATVLSEDERQLTLASLHIDAMVRGRKQSVKVPDVIRQLPCGCVRERGWEGSGISWHLIQKARGIIHKQCNRLVRSISSAEPASASVAAGHIPDS